MFEQSMIPNRARTGRGWTVVVGFLGQLVVVGVAVVVPLIFVDHLPMVKLVPMVYAPPPPPPPPPAPFARAVQVVAVDRQVTRDGGLRAPVFVPPTPKKIVDVGPPPDLGREPGFGVKGGIEGGEKGGVPYSVLRDTAQSHPPVERQKVDTVTKRDEPNIVKPVPMVSVFMEARLINKVKPSYPEPARIARVQGTVNLQAIIGRDGRIRELQVMNGHPFLVKAATDAVRQWVYRPTMLNGQPVEVITSVEVKFILQQ